MSAASAGYKVLVLPARPGSGVRDWLVPAAAVVEIVSADALVPGDPDAPDWLIGTREWRGLAVPTVRIGPTPADGAEAPDRRVRPYLAICPAAAGDPRLTFFAIESFGLPRLEQASAEILNEDPGELPFALALLRLKDRPVALADLAAIESRLLALEIAD